MSQNKPQGKIDLRTILMAILVVVVIYLVATGRLSLFGSGQPDAGGTSQRETQEEIPVVTPAQTSTTVNHPQGGTAADSPAATQVARKTYYFRNKGLLNDHYEKHGREMGFKSAKEYEQAASDVINNPAALYKTEKEDGDHVFFIEETNDFVVLSLDGYIRTYFRPSSGKKYFDRQ